MKARGVLLLNVLLVIAGLAIWHTWRKPAAVAPREGAQHDPGGTTTPSVSERLALQNLLRQDRRQLSGVEMRAARVGRDLALLEAAQRRGVDPATALSRQGLAHLSRQVEEVRRRDVETRRLGNLRVAIAELGLGLTEYERRQVVEIIQRSHAELATHAATLRRQKTGHLPDGQAKYDEIRRRYHTELRALLPERQAEPLIGRFFALR